MRSHATHKGRNTRDVLVAAARFAELKDRLLPALRARGDAPPRQMRPGTGARDAWCANLARLLAAEEGAALVRGFCLYEMAPLSTKRARAPAWRCCFHMVVATRTPSDRVVYVDPNEARRRGDEDAPYIFVPSARAYAAFSDEELLSGQWLVGSVLLGDARVCNAVLAYEQTRGRRASLVAFTPDALVAKRRVVVSFLPHFGTWMRMREIDEDPEALGEMMGMPVHEPGAEADASDALASYQAVASNPESYVPGVVGLQLELECREHLLAGTVTVDKVKTLFFAYYDDTLRAMREAQMDAATERLSQLQL